MIASNEIQDAQITASALCNTIVDRIIDLDNSIVSMIDFQTGELPTVTATPAGLAAQLQLITEGLFQICVLNSRISDELDAIKQSNDVSLLGDMDTPAPIAA